MVGTQHKTLRTCAGRCSNSVLRPFLRHPVVCITFLMRVICGSIFQPNINTTTNTPIHADTNINTLGTQLSNKRNERTANRKTNKMELGRANMHTDCVYIIFIRLSFSLSRSVHRSLFAISCELSAHKNEPQCEFVAIQKSIENTKYSTI